MKVNLLCGWRLISSRRALSQLLCLPRSSYIFSSSSIWTYFFLCSPPETLTWNVHTSPTPTENIDRPLQLFVSLETRSHWERETILFSPHYSDWHWTLVSCSLLCCHRLAFGLRQNRSQQMDWTRFSSKCVGGMWNSQEQWEGTCMCNVELWRQRKGQSPTMLKSVEEELLLHSGRDRQTFKSCSSRLHISLMCFCIKPEPASYSDLNQ